MFTDEMIPQADFFFSEKQIRRIFMHSVIYNVPLTSFMHESVTLNSLGWRMCDDALTWSVLFRYVPSSIKDGFALPTQQENK